MAIVKTPDRHGVNVVPSNEMLDEALAMAARGWPVHPNYHLENGICTCRAGAKCDTPGKHPRVLGWQDNSTVDEATIREWWSRWPRANVGTLTGKRGGKVVLDEDPRHGGNDSLAQLEAMHRKLPHTVEVLTGGGGRQFYFKHPGIGIRIKNSTSELGPGLDIRGEGGQVVAPPSLHKSGRRYAWEASSHPDDTPLAPMPEWLLNMVREPGASSNRQRRAEPAPKKIPYGQQHTRLLSFGGKMRDGGAEVEEIDAALQIMNETRCERPGPPENIRKMAESICRLYPVGEAGKAVRDGAIAPDKAEPDVAVGSPWPDPLDPAALHGLAGDLVRAIEPHTEADPVALLGQFLIAFGNIIGRGPHFQVEADYHPLNEFIALVGPTAKGRKGTSAGHIRHQFKSVDEVWARDRIQGGLSSGEGLIWAVRDPISKVELIREKGKGTGEYQEIVIDPGVTDKRLFVLEAEFASTLRVLGRDGNTLSAIIRQAWDLGDLQTLTKNSPAQAKGAHISIVGHITRDELRRYLDTTEAGNGFANRFLWLCVRRSKCLPEGGHLATVNLAPLLQRLRQAVESARKVGEIKRDENARAIWRKVYPELSEGKPGLLGAMTSRAEAHVMRLASIYALLDLSDLIGAEHLQAALAFWEYAEASARYIFGDSLGDPTADDILRALRSRPDGMTRTDLRDHFGRNKSSAEIARGLGVLLEYGLAYFQTEETEGRPAERWVAVSAVTT
ncbi:MAG: bifunctional DNA primase/polymerase [Chloroflexi bacterium]|nr:bifunctional DNA primase/polymerase [Chloroflexota bacterium]